jgi:hypothetical protein
MAVKAHEQVCRAFARLSFDPPIFDERRAIK